MYFKCIILTGALLALGACHQSDKTSRSLQHRMDSLEARLANTYKPGLGEFMSGIQVHHDKLWFAGMDQNWALANFEINEIRESLNDIRVYCTDRPEIKQLPMIDLPLESLQSAIQQQNVITFKTGFITLTNTCNTCHQATKHAFNVIKVPSAPPFSNQDFAPDNKK
ncbi:hypothetical protein [Niabella sp.]|uniref:hypothetical protein n=1 Tax=Niabella sp. TaxID=1962976 RepID=UPI00261C4022|nr:hypothetical protein [Niabella sp.]